MTWIVSQSTLGERGSPPKIPFGNLRTPDGRRVDDVRPGELASLLIAARVPGVSHENGKFVNAEAYGAFIGSLRKTAGDKEEAAWLEQHRPKATPGAGE